jgi:beta-glucanase (GH16 family)
MTTSPIKSNTIEKASLIAAQDPGLKLVWSDEFNSTTINEKKWIRMPGGSSPVSENKSTGIKFQRNIDSIALDGKGNLKFKMSRDENGVYVGSADADFYSRKKFLYGYFEARVQFCKEPGFWSAFWLMNIPHTSGGNPFIYGVEIDVYEDFFKTNKPKSEAEDTIQHNMFDWRKGQSWPRVTKVKNWSDFHTVGVEWTPLEVIYYVDGVETYRTDPNKQPVSIVPMPVLAGLCWRGGVGTQSGVEFAFYGDIRSAKLPDYLTVDYVRVYQRPAAYRNVPTIKIKSNAVRGTEKKEGDQIKITADLPVGDLGGTVYLFDSGYLIQKTTQRSGVFSITFNQETYQASGPVPLLGTHAFAVITKDANGFMEHSKAIVVEVASKEVSKPYKGTPQSIPGVVRLPFYDEGGKGVAYHDSDKTNALAAKGFRADEGVDTEGTQIGHIYDGEWLKYTVDVKETGTYTIVAAMGTPAQYFSSQGIRLSVDGILVGEWRLDKPTASFGNMARITKKGIRLKKGVRVLKVTALGSVFNARDIEFVRE